MFVLRIIALAVLSLAAIPAGAQRQFIVGHDSVLLKAFRSDLSSAADTRAKDRLAGLFRFPFYCRPCLDDTAIGLMLDATVLVTRKMFREYVADLLLNGPFGEALSKQNAFIKITDDRAAGELRFLYMIAAPHPPFEGRQGLVSVVRRNGKFQITGIDMIP